MNYLPFVGYYFYGAANADERASYFSSWGLLSSAPGYVEEILWREQGILTMML